MSSCNPEIRILPLQDELLLIERVFLRIGSASSDQALEAELHKFLPPIILKLASPSEAVRKKVMELLIHINRRVKDLEHIQLPVEALLAQYQDPNATSFVTNFSIIYIKMGYPRLEITKQVELLPVIFNCLENKPVQHQDSLLFLIMPVFEHVKLPETPEKTASLFSLHEKNFVARLLVEFMSDILLLPYGAIPLHLQSSETRQDPDGPPVAGVPACMSITSFKRVGGESPWKAEDLEKIKISIVKFLASEVLLPNLILLPLLIAAADTRFSIANVAEMALRRLDAAFDFENGGVIASVYVLFLGTLTPKERTPTDKFKNPANTRIRLKLLPFLLKSKEACNYAPLALKVFYECVWGSNSNVKLRQQGVMFLHHIAFTSSKDSLVAVGGVLFSGVVKVIEDEKNDARLRSLAYGALAKLSLKMPSLLLSHSSELHYLQTLMDALIKEEGDVLLAVQEALSMVAPVCAELSPESQGQLCIMLSEHVIHQNPQLRRTAVNYAASVFAKDHFASRFILLIATGDSQEDMRLEAKHHLYKPASEDKDGTPHYQLPSFTSMIAYVMERVDSLPKNQWLEVANNLVPFPLSVLDQIFLYLEHCISVEATGSKKAEDQLIWNEAPKIGKFLSAIIENHGGRHKGASKKGPNVLERYLELAELAASAWSLVALESILRVVAVVPKYLVAVYLTRMDWIRRFVVRGGHYGEVAAHLYGVVAGELKDQREFERALQSVLKTKDLRLDSQESCLLALGHSFGYKLHNLKKANALPQSWDLYSTVAENLSNRIIGEPKTLQFSAILAVGEICRKAPLPIPYKAEEAAVSIETLIAALADVYNNKKLPSKVREQSIMTSAYLCVGQPDIHLKAEIMQRLLSLAKEVSELEIHFAIGEALADCVLGQDSPSGRNPWTEEENGNEVFPSSEKMEEEFPVEEKEKAEMMEKELREEPMEMEEENAPSLDLKKSLHQIGSLEWYLEELLHNYIPQTHPNCKQASCIWLLATLKRCRSRPSIQKYLPEIQAAFMNLLADNNDLIQDAASKGLGVVYECCNDAMRQTMVEGLVATLTSGKRSAIRVNKDTQLFREGELGSGPSGGHLSTYKELCSLATDLNQPELIYKFMNLANHNAVWNSKKGAAFGFGTLASQAGTQLEPYLPQIIPKLYRYQHDPTPQIQQPMASIWHSLVLDTAKTVEKYYEEILDDILTNITHSTWRVRESCCNAITDLLHRQSATKASNKMGEIWKVLFRVQDDIKESVRKAAGKALNALSKSCIKVCENPDKESNLLLKIVLPILLMDGITSEVTEVRSMSVETIVKLCRSGGNLVRPHLGTLIPALLEALSGLEHQAITYTSVRMDDDNREKLDMARVIMAKSSPIMDTLNFVLQFVDEEVLEAVVSGTIDVLKRSVGLCSRVGAAHVVETLTHICPTPLEKFTGKILAALVSGLSDRNIVVRKLFANAIGTVVKTAKPSSIDKLLTKLQLWYLEKEEDSFRVSAALALRSMHSLNSDIMKNHASLALPLTFLAMHAEKDTDGTDSKAVEVWEEIWMENTPGTEAGVRLYLNEIIPLCEQALQSTNWATKVSAGRSLSTVSQKLGPSLTADQTQKIVNLLMMGLMGRTWTGKESLVSALCDASLHTKPILKELKDSETEVYVLDTILNMLSREAKKEKKEYKIYALKSLTLVLNSYKMDRFEEVFGICLPYLALEKVGEELELESQRNSKECSIRWELVDEIVHSLGRAWPVTRETQEKYSEQVVEMLSNSVLQVPRKTQLSIICALRDFWAEHFILEGLPLTLDHPLLGALLHYTCKIFNFCLGVAKFYSLRREALVVLNEFMEKAKDTPVLVNRMRNDLLASVEEAKRDSQPDIQELATSVYKILICE